MKRHILMSALFLGYLSPSVALDVGDISTFIYSNASNVNKEIKNTTDTGRLINIAVERISSPLEDGKVIPKESNDELLLSPASLLLPANARENIRFFYNGPKDNKERYYRIVWFDQSLSDAQRGNNKRNAVASTSARISTILVVAPRDVSYSYHYDNGKIKNTGNGTLRVIAHGPCLKRPTNTPADECKENYYLMPGRDRTFSVVNTVDKKSRIALWLAEEFVPVK